MDEVKVVEGLVEVTTPRVSTYSIEAIKEAIANIDKDIAEREAVKAKWVAMLEVPEVKALDNTKPVTKVLG